MIKKTLVILLFSLVLGAPVLCQDQPVSARVCGLAGCDELRSLTPLDYLAIKMESFFRYSKNDGMKFESEYPGLIPLRATRFYDQSAKALESLETFAAKKQFIDARITPAVLAQYFFAPITDEEKAAIEMQNQQMEELETYIDALWKEMGATPPVDAGA